MSAAAPSYLSQVLPERPDNSPDSLVRLDFITKQWYNTSCQQVADALSKQKPQLPFLSPDVEVLRNAQHTKLRELLEDTLLKRFGIEKGKPVGIFDRWLWTQLNIQTEIRDALIPYSAKGQDPRFEVELGDHNISLEQSREVLAEMAVASKKMVEEIHQYAEECKSKRCTVFVEPNPTRKEAVKLCYGGFKLDINKSYIDKLKRMYIKNSGKEFEEKEFLGRLFCLLLRYHTLG
jgi:hypothetical protein